jgi:hypothetical protein
MSLWPWITGFRASKGLVLWDRRVTEVSLFLPSPPSQFIGLYFQAFELDISMRHRVLVWSPQLCTFLQLLVSLSLNSPEACGGQRHLFFGHHWFFSAWHILGSWQRFTGFSVFDRNALCLWAALPTLNYWLEEKKWKDGWRNEWMMVYQPLKVTISQSNWAIYLSGPDKLTHLTS